MEPNKAFKCRHGKVVKTQSYRYDAAYRYDAKRYKLRCSCGHEIFTGLDMYDSILCENCNLFGNWTVSAKGGITVPKDAHAVSSEHKQREKREARTRYKLTCIKCDRVTFIDTVRDKIPDSWRFCTGCGIVTERHVQTTGIIISAGGKP